MKFRKNFFCTRLLYRFLIVFFPVLVFSFFYCFAQDPQFSQPYNSPLYLNPAFTGTTEAGRAIANYRSQWTRLPGTFITGTFSFDYNLEKYRSAVGLLVSTDKVGTSGLRSSSVSGLYGFFVPLKNDWVVRGGLQFTYANRSTNFYDLTFNDQIKDGQFTGSPTADQGMEGISINYFDFSTGFLAYNKNFWIGISAHHLTQPNQSLNLGKIESKLPVKISIQTGFKIPLSPVYKNQVTPYLIPSIMYRKQDLFQQMDIGMTYLNDPITFGLWYRGYPFKQLAQGYYNQDALVFMAGYKFDNIQMVYSYDATISKLAGTGGSHEVSVWLQFGQDNRRNKKIRTVFPGSFGE